ncbi:MAG: RHS repeat-associated core domain-containing protein, partial [Sphingobacteriales bacterium]
YIVTDVQNTPRRLIDSNDKIVWSWDSTAFGLGDPEPKQSIVIYPEDDEGTEEGGFMVMVLPPPVTFNLRFPGQYYDTENKLFYNLNRYYNPELGRYMEPDPIGLEGGLNPYVYALGNPVMYVDMTGENPILVAMAVGAVFNASIYVGKTAWKTYRDPNRKGGWASGTWSNIDGGEFFQQAAIGAVFGGIGKAAFLAADVHLARAVLPESASIGQKASNWASNTVTNKVREFTTPAGAVITGNVVTGKTSTNLMLSSYNQQQEMRQINQQVNQQVLGQRANWYSNYTNPVYIRELPPIVINATGVNDAMWQLNHMDIRYDLNNLR